MTVLKAKELSIGDVHRLLNFQRQYNRSFAPLLFLESLTEFERQELVQIRDDFDSYLSESKVLEGMVKVLTIFPLMRVAGFYRSPVKIRLEENIADIKIEDEDTTITGRFDIVAIDKAYKTTNNANFLILVIESKNSSIAPSAGLPQLLTYSYENLEHQTSVWGLVTNGELYQFVYIQPGNPLTYQLMPFLNLMEAEPVQLLQVFKALCKLQH